MIHNATELNPLGDHYGVSYALNPTPAPTAVLVQLQEKGERVRVMLSPAEARHMAKLLLINADKVDYAVSHPKDTDRLWTDKPDTRYRQS